MPIAAADEPTMAVDEDGGCGGGGGSDCDVGAAEVGVGYESSSLRMSLVSKRLRNSIAARSHSCLCACVRVPIRVDVLDSNLELSVL